MKAAIAKHLKIDESRIKSIEEWANCLFVVVAGLGSRFVSKKVVAMGQIKCLYQTAPGKYEEMFIPNKPGVYECKADWLCWGDSLWIAYDGDRARVAGFDKVNSTDYRKFNLDRMGKVVENGVVNIGR